MRAPILVSALLLVPAGTLVQKTIDPPTLVYIGTSGDQAKSIHLFRLQPEGDEVFQNVTLVPLGVAAETPRPSSLELDVTRRRLFAVNEVEQGSVSAFAIDGSGRLTPLNQQSSHGSEPCQLALAPDGRHVLAANCGSGNISVLPIGEDGRLGSVSDVQRASTGTTCVAFDPAGRHAFACDSVGDKVLIYRFDHAQGKLAAGQPAAVSLRAGSGPRQIGFRPDGRFAYVVNAKTSTIVTLAYDAGALTEVQSIPTVPESFDGANIAGDLAIHRSGKWLYVSNVGHDSVVLFTVDAEHGTLTFVEEQGTGGRNPRFFGIEPASKHLAISNTDSHTVLASRIDEGNGRLKPSGIFVKLQSPAAVRFLPPVSTVAER